jgi:hypothetical protein
LIEEFIDCELVFTSVGAKNLFTLSEIIAKGIKEKFKKKSKFFEYSYM